MAYDGGGDVEGGSAEAHACGVGVRDTEGGGGGREAAEAVGVGELAVIERAPLKAGACEHNGVPWQHVR